MTRQEVVNAARKLFAADGYEQTTVDRIAREARVSTATVYAQCGGKEGLLRTLMDIWTTSPTVGQILADCAAAPTGRIKLKILAEGYAEHAAEAGDIMRIVDRAAASTRVAEEFLEVADERHMEALETVTKDIERIGELADGLSVTDAARIIFFFFRNPQFALATDRFGWGVERTTYWLLERVESAILKT